MTSFETSCETMKFGIGYDMLTPSHNTGIQPGYSLRIYFRKFSWISQGNLNLNKSILLHRLTSQDQHTQNKEHKTRGVQRMKYPFEFKFGGAARIYLLSRCLYNNKDAMTKYIHETLKPFIFDLIFQSNLDVDNTRWPVY